MEDDIRKAINAYSYYYQYIKPKSTLKRKNYRKRKISSETNEMNENHCIICFSNFIKDELVRRLPCMHLFHEKCIIKWFQTSLTVNLRMYCPICCCGINCAQELCTKLSIPKQLIQLEKVPTNDCNNNENKNKNDKRESFQNKKRKTKQSNNVDEIATLTAEDYQPIALRTRSKVRQSTINNNNNYQTINATSIESRLSIHDGQRGRRRRRI